MSPCRDVSESGTTSSIAVPLSVSVRTGDLSAQPLRRLAEQIETDASAGELGDGARGTEPAPKQKVEKLLRAELAELCNENALALRRAPHCLQVDPRDRRPCT